MKYSQFNTILPHDGSYVIYNSYHQRAIFIESSLKDLLEAAVVEGIDKLESIHPTFYQYLAQEGYLAANETDEVQLVKDLSKSIDYNYNSFMLTVNPTMNCNFKCWYCYETHVKNSSLTSEMVEKINKFVSQTIQSGTIKYFSLAFFGGEPLLYFNRDVKPIIENYIAECSHRDMPRIISFTTNGYLINQDFIDYFNQHDVKCSLQITLDGYKEEHDLVRFVSASKGSYTEIIQNVRLLITNKFSVRLRINYTDKNITNCYKITEEFADISEEIKKKYLIVDYHRVWQNAKIDNTQEVVDANITVMRNEGLLVSGNHSPNNVKNSCYADKLNSAVINYNGDIFKCTARDFTKTKRAGYINENGELIWEEGYIEKRMNIKFKNAPCLKCRLLPLCNGGCSQQAWESKEEYCVYNGDEREKDKIIYSKVKELLGI
jgi:uncharacterized protein